MDGAIASASISPFRRYVIHGGIQVVYLIGSHGNTSEMGFIASSFGKTRDASEVCILLAAELGAVGYTPLGQAVA